MELILDRISKEPNEYSTAMYEQILQETRILCEAQLGVSFESFLAQASLPAMFPLLGALLAVDSSAQGLDFVAQKEYFRHFALLSHTVQLCTQMLQDLSEPALPNQKYFAHQIALVFQCLAGLGPVAEPYRARIQSEFDGLKRALDQPAGLQAAQVSMLRALLGDVRAAVRALSPGVLRRAQPAVQHVLAVYAS